jgi:hypothetical protein
MSKAEIAAEISRLPRTERRDLARLIFEMEEDADVLRECDGNANEHLLMLDALEAKDEQTGAA